MNVEIDYNVTLCNDVRMFYAAGRKHKFRSTVKGEGSWYDRR